LIKCTSCLLHLALSCQFANNVQVHASYCYVPLTPTFGYDRTQQRLSAHCAPSLKIPAIRSLIDLSLKTYFDAVCILSRLLQTMLKCVLFSPVVLGKPTALPTFEKAFFSSFTIIIQQKIKCEQPFALLIHY
jgi:hypothetical protein